MDAFLLRPQRPTESIHWTLVRSIWLRFLVFFNDFLFVMMSTLDAGRQSVVGVIDGFDRCCRLHFVILVINEFHRWSTEISTGALAATPNSSQTWTNDAGGKSWTTFSNCRSYANCRGLGASPRTLSETMAVERKWLSKPFVATLKALEQTKNTQKSVVNSDGDECVRSKFA